MSANNNNNGDADSISSDDLEFTDLQVFGELWNTSDGRTNITLKSDGKTYNLPVALPHNSHLNGYLSKQNFDILFHDQNSYLRQHNFDIVFRGQIISSNGFVFRTETNQQGVNRYIKLNADDNLYQLDDGRYNVMLCTKQGTLIGAVYELLYNRDHINAYDNIKFANGALERIYVDNKQLDLSGIKIHENNLISSLLQNREVQERIAEIAYIQKHPLFKVEKVEKNMINKKRDRSPDNDRVGGGTKSMLNLGSQSNKKIKSS